MTLERILNGLKYFDDLPPSKWDRVKIVWCKTLLREMKPLLLDKEATAEYAKKLF